MSEKDILLPPGHDIPEWADAILDGKTIITDTVSNDDYHAARGLVSKSALDRIARSPAHYLHWLDAGATDDGMDQAEEEVKSDALIIGSAFHSLLLEPLKFSKEYGCLPDFGDMRSSKRRAERDAFLAENPGVTFIKPDQWSMIHGMRESVFRHKRMRRILENGRPEVTIAAVDPDTGLVRKVKFDWLSELEGVAFDAKSALDGSEDMWRISAARHRYEVQDAFYDGTAKLAGLDLDGMAFGVVEKSPPYVTGLYLFGPTSRLAGQLRVNRDMERIAECCSSGRFPGYGNGNAHEVELPGWATSEVRAIT